MGQVGKGQLKLGHVEGGVLGLHFVTEDGQRFAITNITHVSAEEMQAPPSWATFLRGERLRSAGAWRIQIEAQQLRESPQEAAADYDYDLVAEELPDPPQDLDGPATPLLEAFTEKPPCGG